MDLDKLPKWALPVGIGGIAGVAVLVTRKPGTGGTPTGVIPVGDITPGSDNQPTWLQGILDTLQQNQSNVIDTLTNNEQTQNDQLTAFLDNFTSLQSGTTQQLTDLIHSQDTQFTTGQSQLSQLIAAMQTQFQAQLDAMMQLVQHPPTTGGSSLIDMLKQRFKSAFDMIQSPAGTPQPNSDITTGTLTNAPYSSDPGFTYYATSGHYVTGPFRQFLGNFGHATTWGRPISQVFRDSDGYDTQVFEHSIMKYIPGSDPTHYNIVAFQVM